MCPISLSFFSREFVFREFIKEVIYTILYTITKTYKLLWGHLEWRSCKLLTVNLRTVQIVSDYWTRKSNSLIKGSELKLWVLQTGICINELHELQRISKLICTELGTATLIPWIQIILRTRWSWLGLVGSICISHFQYYVPGNVRVIFVEFTMLPSWMLLPHAKTCNISTLVSS